MSFIFGSRFCLHDDRLSPDHLVCSFWSVVLCCMSRALDHQEECFRYSLCPELELNDLGIMFVERMLAARNIIRIHLLRQEISANPSKFTVVLFG